MDDDTKDDTNDDAWLIGQTFERFVVRGILGRGGMGLVVEAHDPMLDRQVALKLVLDRRASSGDGQRLLREARAMARLAHPNVVSVYEVGTVAGQVFLVMELVRGRTFAAWLATEPPASKILEAFAAAGAGLHAAHRVGLIHRDFKPSNVLVDEDGRIRVTDFGIALQVVSDPVDLEDRGESAARDDEDDDWKSRLARLTRTGAAIGTPRYMAPEQRPGGEVTPQTDQFAFCIALWEALFKRHPFGDGEQHDRPGGVDDRSTVVMSTESLPRTDDPRPPPRHDVPKPVIVALHRGLHRDPDKRWPSMEALLIALVPRRRRWPWAVVPAVIAGGALAVGFGLARSEPSCQTVSNDRIARVWNDTIRAQVRAAFVGISLPAAGSLADRTLSELDQYAERWTKIFADGCTNARASRHSFDVTDKRLACLDYRLQTMSGVLAAFLDRPTADVVSRAQVVTAALPAPEDCMNDQLGETQQPPSGTEAQVSVLYRRLGEAEANVKAGRLSLAASQLAGLRDAVDRTGWAPLRVRTRLATGTLAAMRGTRSIDLLTSAAQEATANRMDLVASKAWASALTSAGSALSQGQIDLLAGMARAQAQRTGAPLQVTASLVAEGRALSRRGNFARAEALCREALTGIGSSGSKEAREFRTEATKCLVETLGPQERWDELEQLVRGLLDGLGADQIDHPARSDYLELLGEALWKRRPDEARKAVEQSLEIRRRTHGEAHPSTVRLYSALALLHIEVNELDQAEVILHKAVALIEPAGAIPNLDLPTDQHPSLVLAMLHRDLGLIAMGRNDPAGASTHFATATELTKQVSGDTSPTYAALLVMLSQAQGGMEQTDAAIASNRKAHTIFVAYGDKSRANQTTGMLGMLYAYAERWTEARPVLEEAVANLAPTTSANTRSIVMLYLAKAYFYTAELAKAAELARGAEKLLAADGPGSAGTLKRLRDWMRKSRISPR